MVMDPALMATADGPMGPPPVQGQPNAIMVLQELLGQSEMEYQQVQEVASLAIQALQQFMSGGMAGGLATMDGMMGLEPMPGMEDDMGAEEPMEPEDEMATEYR